MITLHENGVRATKRPLRDDIFTCSRCGTHNRARTRQGSPWCADCIATIAIDPAYLTAQNPPDVAQALLDKWVNNRRGVKRRVLVEAV